MSILNRLITTGYAASLQPAAKRWRQAAADVAAAQQATLLRHVEAGTDTRFGREHGYSGIRSIVQFQERIPVMDANDLRPWIEEAAAGQPDVLSPGHPMRFEPTGGSSGVPKLLPITHQFLQEVQAGVNPWILDLYRHVPGLHGHRAYWSITPVASDRSTTPGGIPIGGQDTDYLGPVARQAWRRLMAVPPHVAHEPDMHTWRTQTLSYLARAEDLALISCWSPTFLILMLNELEAQWDQVLATLPLAHRHRVATRSKTTTKPGALWPNLRVVSSWTHGPSARHARELASRLPQVILQGKGLLATEGIVSVPRHSAPDPVTVPNGHFLEFLLCPADGAALPADAEARPRLVHELEAGEAYEVLLTTGAGLARYRIGDIVNCTGHWQGLPMLRFEGRGDLVSDLVGEKLHAHRVEACLLESVASTGIQMGFALLAPQQDLKGYRLHVEATPAAAARLAKAVDARLCRDPGYEYARRLGQLLPLEGRGITGGLATWEKTCVQAGQRLGDLKPSVLDRRPIWDDAFEPWSAQ